MGCEQLLSRGAILNAVDLESERGEEPERARGSFRDLENDVVGNPSCAR